MTAISRRDLLRTGLVLSAEAIVTGHFSASAITWIPRNLALKGDCQK